MPDEIKQKEQSEKSTVVEEKKGGRAADLDEEKSITESLKDTISNKLSEKMHPSLKSDKDLKTEKPQTEKGKGVQEGAQTEKLYSVSDITKDLSPKKVVKMILLLILLILIALAVYVRFVRKTPVNEPPHLVNPPTPSYFQYQKYKPSIYAEDSNFKKLDEGISVLENEVKSVQLEETTLLPPSLDFDVVFKD